MPDSMAPVPFVPQTNADAPVLLPVPEPDPEPDDPEFDEPLGSFGLLEHPASRAASPVTTIREVIREVRARRRFTRPPSAISRALGISVIVRSSIR